MSFTVSFDSCWFRGRKAKVLNPFTKQRQEIEVPEPMTPAEWKSVVRVLKTPNQEFNLLNVEFPDGGRAEVSNHSTGGQLESFVIGSLTPEMARFLTEIRNCGSILVRIGSLTPELTRFLIDLLKAANWMMTIDSSATLVVASEELAKGLPKEVGPAVVCDSPDELAALLSPGFAKWNTIRNEIANGIRRPGNTPKPRRPKK